MSSAEQLGMFPDPIESNSTELDLGAVATHIGAHAIQRPPVERTGVYQELGGGLPVEDAPTDTLPPATPGSRSRTPRLPEFVPTGQPRHLDDGTILNNVNQIRALKENMNSKPHDNDIHSSTARSRYANPMFMYERHMHW